MANNYYNLTNLNFRNTIYSLNIAIETHFANLLFGGDATRIIYSSTENSLRTRAKNQSWNNLYLPFMNYRIDKITQPSLDRPWWQHTGNISGVYCEELQKKLRYTPIRVSYDSTFYIHRDDDLQYAMAELIFDDSNETTLTPTITIDGYTVNLHAVLGYNLDYEPDFTDQDWFQKNRIHSISLNFELDYMYIKDNTSGFGIPETVIFNFGRMHDETGNTIDETYNFIIDRFNETVTPTS